MKEDYIKIYPVKGRPSHLKMRSSNEFFKDKQEFTIDYDEYSIYLQRPDIDNRKRVRKLVPEGKAFVNTFTDLNVDEICGDYIYDAEDSTEDNKIFNKQ